MEANHVFVGCECSKYVGYSITKDLISEFCDRTNHYSVKKIETRGVLFGEKNTDRIINKNILFP